MKFRHSIMLFAALAGVPCIQALPAKAESAAQEQDPITVTTRIDPEAPRLGDLIRYQINVAYPAGYAVNLPARVELPPLKVIRSESGAEASSGEGFRRQFTIELQAFSLKQAKIPSLELTYVDPQAQVHSKKVPAHPLEMHALTANEAQPERRGEDPMRSPEYPNDSAELVIYALLGGILLGGALYALWRWKAAQPAPQAPKPKIPPHERASGRLDRLEAGMKERFDAGGGALFYLELTEIAKGYLGEEFRVECLDRTSYEIQQLLDKDPECFHPISAQDVRDFLKHSDLIKFARSATDEKEARSELERVRDWVVSTRAASQKVGAQAESEAPNSAKPEKPQEETVS